MKKFFEGGQVWIKQVKFGLKIRFFVIFSSLVHKFSFKLYRMITWDNVEPVEIKIMKINLWVNNWA